MPSYEDTLTERELDLLVRWMTKDYAPTKLEPEKLKVQEPALDSPKETATTPTE